MSKPPTHSPIASPSSHGSGPAPPPAATQPPTGATAIARPRKNCVYAVYLFASEYQNTIASATGLRMKHNGFNCAAPYTNTDEAMTTKMPASVRVIAPRGSSRIDVRGFNASCRASASLLKPIAALSAVTMQAMIHATCDQENG